MVRNTTASMNPSSNPPPKVRSTNTTKSLSFRTFIMLSNFSGHVFHRNKTRCNSTALVLLFKPCSYLSLAAPALLDTALHLNPLCLQDLPHKPLSLPSATALDKNFPFCTHIQHSLFLDMCKLHSNRLMLPRSQPCFLSFILSSPIQLSLN